MPHSSATLIAALDAANGAVTISDMRQPERPLTYVNQAFTRITGYTQKEALGRNCRFLQGSGTGQDHIQQLRNALNAHQPITLELLNYRKNGEAFINHLRLAPIINKRGVCTAYIGMQMDVTAERQREQKFQKEQKFNALGKMVGGVAHEINNLLQPILLMSENIQHHPALLNNSELQEDIEVICHSVKTARHIVRDLLLFAGGQALPKHIAFPVVESLGQALCIVRHTVPASVHLVIDEWHDHHSFTMLSATDWVQILNNLFHNAMDAMENKGTIRLQIQPQTDQLLLVIEDSGTGVSPHIIASIFDPYFTTKPLDQGTGLGLSIVHSLVHGVGGNIHVENISPQGARFSLYVPSFESL